MFSYRAYGFGILSSLPLPELISADAPADVRISVQASSHPAPSVTAARPWHQPSPGMLFLAWPDVGTFEIRGGREIVIFPAPEVDHRTLRLFLLGQALPVILYQRGLLTLHASAAGIYGGAVGFLGLPGWGKSTLAAACHARGHSLVADDLLAVWLDGSEPVVYPGFPQLKMWPRSVEAMGADPETLPKLREAIEKRALRVMERFQELPLPLRRLYVIAEGDEDRIEPLRPAEAAVELLRHQHCGRIAAEVQAASRFQQCAALANRVPIRRLHRRRSLPSLPSLVRMLEEDLAGD